MPFTRSPHKLKPPPVPAPARVFPVHSGGSRVEEAQWRTLRKRVKAYGWLTLSATVLGSLRLAHPRLFGKPRLTTCTSSACVWAMHLIEVPLVSYLSFVSLYALRRVSRATARRFQLLVGLSNVVELALFTFDSLLLIDSFRRGAPRSEKRTYAFAVSLLLVGAGLGQWIRLRVNDHLNPPLDPRFVHPQTEEQLILLVKQARALGVQLRVRGSMHCVPQGIFTDEGEQHINVQLDRYNEIVDWDEGEDEHGKRLLVTVQAGCHLGVDPGNPASSKKNSLLWQLEKHGWALPDLGGITHQTVSGFLSTGSMGGTTRHDLGGAIVGIRLIDGTGEPHDLAPDPTNEKDEQENPFYAAGVSMGLLGIVSTVTLECRPRYDLIGKQVTSKTGECAIKLFESGEDGLQRYLEEHEDTHSRLLWWPQPGVDKVEVWKARRTRPGDQKRTFRHGRFTRRPFVSVPRILQALIVNPFYNLIACDAPPFEKLTADLVRMTINAFVDDGETKEFWGPWLEILPMDNQISDEHVPTDFTELFMDISETQAVMTKLKEFFDGDDGGMERVGPYAFEIYAGHKSRFWMSPSYGRHSIRVNVFWFRTERSGRDRFFAQFWKLLQESTSGVRLHWGKYLPEADSSTGAAYLRQQYPMWDKFREVRERMDPDGIFLSTYWRKHLGLEASHARPMLKAVKQAAVEEPARGSAAVEEPARGFRERLKTLGRRASGRVAPVTRRGRLRVAVAIVRRLNTLRKVIRRPVTPMVPRRDAERSSAGAHGAYSGGR